MATLDAGDTALATISVMSILLGLPLNLTMLVYFITYTGKRPLSILLYTLICAVDIIIITLHFPVTLSYLASRDPLLFKSGVFCAVWGILWNTVIRLSVVSIAVLCVSRMMAVVFPLRILNRRIPIYLVSLFNLLMLLQSSVPFWFGSRYEYDNLGVTCYDGTWYGFVHFFIVGVLEFLVPLLVVIPSCIISIWALYRSKSSAHRRACALPDRHKLKNRATITMILLTTAYIVFNAPLVLYTTFGFFQLKTQTTMFNWFLNAFHGHEVEEKGRFHLLNFSFSISVCLNSTINAMLYTSRCTVIKTWFRGILRRNKQLLDSIAMKRYEENDKYRTHSQDLSNHGHSA